MRAIVTADVQITDASGAVTIDQAVGVDVRALVCGVATLTGSYVAGVSVFAVPSAPVAG